MQNYYEILGVDPTAPSRAIREAFRAKALKIHSDKGGNDDEMALLNEAYQTLYNPQQRAAFDRDWAIHRENEEDAQPIPIAGHLMTAGTPFSDSFRKQHHKFLQQYHAKPLPSPVEPVRTYFKPPEQTTLYQSYYKTPAGASEVLEANDLVSFLAYKIEKGYPSFPVIRMFTTPQYALGFFSHFLQGCYFGEALQKSATVLAEIILKLKSTPLPSPVRSLYEGIHETIQILQQGNPQDGKLLTALQKITDYAKQQIGPGLDPLMPLLQSKYFRALYIQALHADWGSPEPLTAALMAIALKDSRGLMKK